MTVPDTTHASNPLSPLRIASCISLFWPEESGAERQARRQAEELIRRGHRVSVITRARPGCPTYESLDGIDLRRVITPWSFGPTFGLTFVTRMANYLVKHRDEFDLIHCHQGLWEAVAAGLAHRRTGIPTVVKFAASGPYGEAEVLKRTRGGWLLRKQILRNSAFVATSRNIATELSELGVDPERIHLIGSGVDPEEFFPAPSSIATGLPPSPRVLFVGRLHPQKNLRMLLDAWKQLLPSVPGSLILVGEGSERTALTLYSMRLQIQDRVHFLGPVKNVLDYYRAGDLFVLPSHSEGMSNSLLEAMSCGLPAIVASSAGSADLVRDRETGLVIDSRNVESLTAALRTFLTDETFRRSCGARAREFILAHNSLAAIVNRYEDLYRKTIAASIG